MAQKRGISGPKDEQELMDKLRKPRGLQKKTKVKPPKPESLKEHTVAAGDSLSKIAAQYYGDGSAAKWKAIYEANKETIGDNPSLIRPGQVLKIPSLDQE